MAHKFQETDIDVILTGAIDILCTEEFVKIIAECDKRPTVARIYNPFQSKTKHQKRSAGRIKSAEARLLRCSFRTPHEPQRFASVFVRLGAMTHSRCANSHLYFFAMIED